MTTPLRVLLVEDNPDDADLLLRALEREGYDTTHRRVETAREMRLALLEEEWDLILCDWSLPGFEAPEALEILKATGLEVPFVIVSGTIGEETAVEAMRVGAHDFLVKNNLTRLGPVVARELGESAERKRRWEAEQALRLRDAILNAVGSAADRLVRAASWEGVVEQVLDRVGPATHANRILVYENRAHGAGREGVLRLAWREEGSARPQSGNGWQVLRWARLIPLWDLAIESAGVAVNAGDPRLSQDARRWMARHEVRSLCLVPIRSGTVWWGAMAVVHHEGQACSDAVISALRVLADALGASIERNDLLERLTRSHAELTDAYNRTLEGWARALDLRDQETAGHTRRVTELTVRMARAMGMDGENLVHIRRGAVLHDIGKMGVPDQILRKKGPLSEEEWVIMRQHPVFAYELLSSIPYLAPALEIPYAHHERWNGTGYPRGLAGEQIPIAARMFAVVDVWDAMISDRPYRPALPPDEVMGYIVSQAGLLFDRAVVRVFQQLITMEEMRGVSALHK